MDKTDLEMRQLFREAIASQIHEALKIKRAIDLIIVYTEEGLLNHTMSLMAALEALVERIGELTSLTEDDEEEETAGS